MWFFYEEQLRRMENMPSGETVLFEDVVCQLHDMLQPEAEGAYTIRWGRGTFVLVERAWGSQ